MDLHPYDNVERRFRHTDTSVAGGLSVVAQLLHLAEPPACEGTYFDMLFFSGGIGVIDDLAISLSADLALWSETCVALHLRTPEELIKDVGSTDDFLWLLLSHEDEFPPIRGAAIQFINNKRRVFQTQCQTASRITFCSGSNVNDWIAVWGDDLRLNYLGYSQG